MLGAVPCRRNGSLFHFPTTFDGVDRPPDEWMTAFEISETDEPILVKRDLPGMDVQSDDSESEYQDGVLRLSIPESEAAKSGRIEVKSH